MHRKLAPHVIELTKDACLKAFWYKKALRTFLKLNDIDEAELATWASDESKREFLDRLFESLISLEQNSGHSDILEIATSLSKMTYFTDLENCEDSSIKIKAAKEAIARLKIEVKKITGQLEEEKNKEELRKIAQEKRMKIIKSQQSLEKLSENLNKLTPLQGIQEGGYKFEEWFYELVTYFEIQCRPSYRVDGRQIDGSLTLDGTTFLIETKFAMEPSGSPEIDVFYRKVTTKADNTMGIFVSMAGYNSGAVKAASCERTPLLLMDYSHIYNLILSGIMDLPNVVRRIKRHASQTGESFLPVDKFSG